MSATGVRNLEQVVEDWADAELHGDTSRLEHMLTDEFVGVGPRGFMLTRPEWIQRHQSGDLKYQSFKFEELKMRVYGDTVITTGRLIQTATYQGHAVPGEFRATVVLVNGQGPWRVASVHLSPILPAP